MGLNALHGFYHDYRLTRRTEVAHYVTSRLSTKWINTTWHCILGRDMGWTWAGDNMKHHVVLSVGNETFVIWSSDIPQTHARINYFSSELPDLTADLANSVSRAPEFMGPDFDWNEVTMFLADEFDRLHDTRGRRPWVKTWLGVSPHPCPISSKWPRHPTRRSALAPSYCGRPLDSEGTAVAAGVKVYVSACTPGVAVRNKRSASV